MGSSVFVCVHVIVRSVVGQGWEWWRPQLWERSCSSVCWCGLLLTWTVTGWQRFEQWVAGVCDVSDDTAGFLLQSTFVDVIKVGQLSPNDALSSLHHPLQVLPLCGCAAGVPHSYAAGQGAFNSRPIEVYQQLLWKPGLSQFPQEKQSLLCLFHQVWGPS